MPLFTTRRPAIQEEEEEIVPLEDDLVIDDLDCEDLEEVKIQPKADKIVLVRKTQEDREIEKILVK